MCLLHVSCDLAELLLWSVLLIYIYTYMLCLVSGLSMLLLLQGPW